MAETYRGLTIRIGGDTTSLQKSLQAVNSAARETEGQLRKMKQALSMDPGSTDAIATNLRLVGQRAVEAQSRLSQLKQAVREVGGQNVELLGGERTTQTVREIADATSDAAKRAAEAKKNYAEVVNSIAELYTPIDRAVRKTDEFAQAWRDAHDGAEFKTSDLIDESGLDGAIGQLRQLGAITDEQEEAMRRLSVAYREAFDENETAKAVEGFRDLEVEVTKSEAQAGSLAQRFAELSREAAAVKMDGGIEQRMQTLDAATSAVNDEISQLDHALQLDPGNVEAMALKMRDLQEAAGYAQERARLLEKEISQLDADGVGELSAKTRDVAASAEEAREAYDDASKAVTEFRGEIDRLSERQSLLAAKDQVDGDEYRELGDRISEARAELDRLIAEQERAEGSFQTADSVQQYRNLQAELAETRSEASRLNDEMSELGSANAGVTGSSLVSLGMSLSTTVTPALVQAGGAMVDAARDIDSAYRDMRKTVDGTESDFESLREAAVDFSTTHVTSADQILSIQAIGGELGVATDSLKTFAETVSNIEVASNLDAEEAATALGQLSNICDDLTSDKFPSFSDALVRLGNNGASTESQITDIATRIGSMGSIVGMSTPDILAWASTIASTGQNAEAAGTAISNAMSAIETAVANGGSSLESFADVAGTTAEDFADTWNSNPTQALKSFIEGLNRIEEEGGSADATLEGMEITAVRQKQAIMGLMQTIDGLDANLQMSNDAWNGVSDQWGEAGDAAREASAKAEGFSGSLSRLENVAQAFGAELGESLTPVISGAADALGALYDIFADLPDGVKTAIVAIGGLAAAIGPLMLLVKGFKEFSAAVDAMGKAKKAASALKGAVKALGTSMTATEASTGLLAGSLSGGLAVAAGVVAVGAIAALIAKQAEYSKRQEESRKATEGLADACRVASSGMQEAESSAQTYSEAMSSSSDAVGQVREGLADLTDRFNELNAETSASVGALDNAYRTISSLGGQSGLSAQQVGQLKAAVQTLNDQLGTSYEVARDGDGAYQVMADGAVAAKDAIYDLVEAKKQEIQFEAQQEKYKDLYSQQVDAADAYQQAVDAAAEAQQHYNDVVAQYGDDKFNPFSQWKIMEAQAALDEANGTVAEAGEYLNGLDEDLASVERTMGNMTLAAEEASGSLLEFALGSNEVNSALGGDTDVIHDFTDAVEESGVGVGLLSQLTSTQLTDLASKWRDAGGSVKDILSELGIVTQDTFAEMSDAISTFGGPALTELLGTLGYDIDQLGEKMTLAGVKTSDLAAIGSSNFAALAASAGGDMDKLLFMIENYNATPIADKQGNISVDVTELYGADGEIYTWNGTQLEDKEGNVVVDQLQLTDAYDNVVEWNGEELRTLEGEVKTNYDELTAALGELEDFAAWDGYTATVRLNTVKTTTTQTVNRGTVSGGSSVMSLRSVAAQPASAQPVAASLSAEQVAGAAGTATYALAARSMKQTAAQLANDPSAIAADAARSAVLSFSREPGNRRSLREEKGGSGQVVNSYNVTIDGTGTTARVQQIALDLLDELEREARL